MKTMRFTLALSLLLAVSSTAQAQLVAAVLPSARAVSVGSSATAFATIINAGTTAAIGCSVSAPTLVLNPATPVPATFADQTTDPAAGFQIVPNMKHPRGYHSAAILLPDGSVIMGGDPNGGATPNERYRPSYFFKTRPVITAA